MLPSFFRQTCRRFVGWSRRPSQRRKRRSFRPLELELLESRLVLDGGTWTPLTNNAPADIGTMLLLPNGVVMAQQAGISANWYQLTPDNKGNYNSGTWTQAASMGTARLYFPSHVLPSGELLVVGGEYDSSGKAKELNTGEIYDPSNGPMGKWTAINSVPTPDNMFGDSPTEMLPDGTVLAGYLGGPQTYFYDPSSGEWTNGPNKLYNDSSAEETFLMLPDNSILTYDIGGTKAQEAQRYVPSMNQWVDAGKVPVQLGDNGGNPNQTPELGPSFLLPDGRVFFIGANSNTALYTPSTNTWAAGPQIPNNLGGFDAPGAMMPDGNVLFAVGPHVANSMKEDENYPPPTVIYEFEPNNDSIEAVGVPRDLSETLQKTSVFTTRMLMLPSGQVLFSDFTNQLWLFTPNGSPDPSWQPTIYNVVDNGNSSFTMTGTQLNGISEGANYGDDAEMSSNYPIVQLTDLNGNVFRTSTYNWTPSVSAVGDTTVQSVNFTLPSGVASGYYYITTTANGISSNPLAFYVTPAEATAPAPAAGPSTPMDGGDPSNLGAGNAMPPAPGTAINAGDTSLSFQSTPSTGISSNDSSVPGTSFLNSTPTAMTPPLAQTLDAMGTTASRNAFSPSVTYLLGKGGSSTLSSPINSPSDTAAQSSNTAAVDALFTSDPFATPL